MVLLAYTGALHAQLFGAGGARPDPVYYGSQVEAGNLSQVRQWLEAGMDPNYVADRIGTGLMIAAWHGNLPIMALLVERGADVNRSNNVGERALMHAAWRGQLEAVKWLLSKGARVDSEPMTWSPLHYAVFGGHKEAAALLLERGADINARSTNGSSVLMMAVYEGHEDLARELVKRGADTSLKNDRGEGALEWAFKFKRLAIARIVSEQGAFATAANRPAIHWTDLIRPRSQTAPAAGPPPPGTDLPTVVLKHDPLIERIEELQKMRDTLVSRGMKDAAAKLDERIARLRAQRARANQDSVPAAVLEISAKRGAPADQKTRLIFEGAGPPP